MRNYYKKEKKKKKKKKKIIFGMGCEGRGKTCVINC